MKRSLFLLACLFGFISAKAQSAEQLLLKGKQLGANEIVYLHTDKSSFLPGETVWFKAYALAGKETVADKSIININLVAPGNRLVENKRMLSKNGAAASFFVLPANDSIKYYTLQAFTSGMMTLDSSVVFSKKIFLKNDCNQHDLLPGKKLSLQVFTEGEYVIEDLPATFAFKTEGLNNYTDTVFGKVTDEKGDTAVSFTSLFNGMGKFEFTPVAGKTYKASVNINGNKLSVPVTIKQSPYQTILNIYPVNGGVVYRVRSKQTARYHLTIQCNYDVKYKADLDFSGADQFAKFLPGNVLGTGINHFILMDDNNNIAAQRLFYNMEGKATGGDDIFIADTLTSKAEVIIHLDNLKAGNYSIAIANAGNTPGRVFENMQMAANTSAINNGTQQFAIAPQNETDSVQQLYYDLLMLTNTSLRYDGNKLKQIFTKQVQDDGDAIKTLGVLTDAENNRVLKEKDLTIFIKQGDTLKGVVQTASDINGLVKLPSITLEDTATVYFRQPAKEYPKYMLKIVPLTAKAYVKSEEEIKIKPCDNITQKVKDEINSVTAWTDQHEKLLQGVTVTGIKRSPQQLTEEKYVSPWFTSLSNERGSFDFINDYTNMGNNTVLNFLKNRVMISGSGDVSGANLILNESVVDQGIMNEVSLSDVAIIKVMGPNYIPPVSPYIAGAPTVIVYTKKGNDNVNGTLGVFKMKFNGFATDKTYFNPFFDEGVLTNKQRGTLYWNADLKPGKAKTIYCRLLNKDAKNLRIVIEGVDEKGNLVSISKEVTIRN